MTSETNVYFGFDLLNNLVDSQLTKKEDVIVLFCHWYFVRNGFKCIGFGDSKTFDASVDRGSELLPADWNQHPNYSLRYIKDKQLYIFIATKSDADLLLNFLGIANNCVSNIEFPIDSTVGSIHGPLESLIPNHSTVLNKLQKELVEPVCAGTAKEISTQTQSAHPLTHDNPSAQADNDPLRAGPSQNAPRQQWYPGADPRNIGRSDLDPFAGGVGGGMIFNPFAPRGPDPLNPRGSGGLGVPGRLPPGAIPPGARFDPFGPPDLGGPRPRGGRDADHLPPPGYDDMFM